MHVCEAHAARFTAQPINQYTGAAHSLPVRSSSIECVDGAARRGKMREATVALEPLLRRRHQVESNATTVNVNTARLDDANHTTVNRRQSLPSAVTSSTSAVTSFYPSTFDAHQSLPISQGRAGWPPAHRCTTKTSAKWWRNPGGHVYLRITS
jgi:hypothetical protein